MPAADRTMILEVKNLDKLEKLLTDMANMRYWRMVLQAALLTIKDEVARNPGPVHHPVIWASRAQQVAYIMSRKAAGMPLKYGREGVSGESQSQRLLAGWTTQISADGRSGTVGSRASYGPYVMDEILQTTQHRTTGWRTIQEVGRDAGPDIVEALVGEIDDMVKRAKA